MPFSGVVFEEDLVLFVIDHHSQSPHVIDAEEWTCVIACPIDQVHVDRFPFEQP